jgi:hypothetical protein
VTPAELRALLVDALALWGVAGRVDTEGEGVAIATDAGPCRLRPAPRTARPVRWWVDTPERIAAGRGPRPASSIVAALAVVRAATDVA